MADKIGSFKGKNLEPGLKQSLDEMPNTRKGKCCAEPAPSALHHDDHLFKHKNWDIALMY